MMLFKSFRIHCHECGKDRIFSEHVKERTLGDLFLTACPDCGAGAVNRRITFVIRAPAECLAVMDEVEE